MLQTDVYTLFSYNG